MAQFHSIDKLMDQTKALTATAEAIKARISDEVATRKPSKADQTALMYNFSMSFSLYVNHPHSSGTFHDVNCSHSTSRKKEQSDNGFWLDDIESEAKARFVLEGINQANKTGTIYKFRRCRDCAPESLPEDCYSQPA
jgi:hypothetical protein